MFVERKARKINFTYFLKSDKDYNILEATPYK